MLSHCSGGVTSLWLQQSFLKGGKAELMPVSHSLLSLRQTAQHYWWFMYMVAVALAGLELLNYINMFDYLFMGFFCDAHQLVIQHSLMNITSSLLPWESTDLGDCWFELKVIHWGLFHSGCALFLLMSRWKLIACLQTNYVALASFCVCWWYWKAMGQRETV